MIRIVVEVDATAGKAIGIKEDLAMWLERNGDCRVVEVSEILPEQGKINLMNTRLYS